jgi:hypothetical protein
MGVARRLYPLTYPARVGDDEPGCDRERVVNSERLVNQRFGEFWAEIRGVGRNLQGTFRTLVAVSLNRERWPVGGIGVTPCGERP